MDLRGPPTLSSVAAELSSPGLSAFQCVGPDGFQALSFERNRGKSATIKAMQWITLQTSQGILMVIQYKT